MANQTIQYALPQDGGLIDRDSIPLDILGRFEKLPTFIYKNESEAVNVLADRIVADINATADGLFSIALTSGNTPRGIYRELVDRYRKGEVSFRNVEVFSLDEFYPIAPLEPNSRNFRIHDEFLNHVDILSENVHLPDCKLPISQMQAHCEEYERRIEKIDLMIIGVGKQGQLGFNEAGSYPNSFTRLVQLSYASRKVQSKLFPSFNETPSMAVTMGLGTIMKARKIVVMAWGEGKSDAVARLVEGPYSEDIPATLLQTHRNVSLVVDENAAQKLTRMRSPWLVGDCNWTRKFTRKAVVWLSQKVGKPVLKLTHQDYMENSLGPLLESRQATSYDINIEVFNDLQHTITGWPGGKPDADDSTRPVKSVPFPKRVLIFSPHPDDDVISMGGTFIRLFHQGHDVHVAYETSGNYAVHDDVVLQHFDTARELGLNSPYDHVKSLIANKKAGQPEPVELRQIKAAIRRGESRGAVASFGLNPDTHTHFLNLPFYETGTEKKNPLSEADIEIIRQLMEQIKPHQIYLAGDLSDPHGTHRICTEAVLEAFRQLVAQKESWTSECHLWLYRGAWQEWDLDMVDMAVPLSPDEMLKKRHAIYKHLSQKDIVPFPGNDNREFWQRAEERTQHTAQLYDALGMAEYQAIEVFVEMDNGFFRQN